MGSKSHRLAVFIGRFQPFHIGHRAVMASAQDHADPINVLPLVDTLYNDRAWATNVRTAVMLHLRNMGFDPSEVEISLIGMEKDKSSAYLRWFPEWKMVPSAAHYHNDEMINATDMREYLFFPQDQSAQDMAARFGGGHLDAVYAWMAENPERVRLSDFGEHCGHGCCAIGSCADGSAKTRAGHGALGATGWPY